MNTDPIDQEKTISATSKKKANARFWGSEIRHPVKKLAVLVDSYERYEFAFRNLK